MWQLNFQAEYPTKGVYLGNSDDRRKQLSILYEEFSPNDLKFVSDTNPVLKETIGAYNNTILVLLQSYSIVSTAAIGGSPKCLTAKVESFKNVQTAQMQGIECLKVASNGILKIANENSEIVSIREVSHFAW